MKYPIFHVDDEMFSKLLDSYESVDPKDCENWILQSVYMRKCLFTPALPKIRVVFHIPDSILISYINETGEKISNTKEYVEIDQSNGDFIFRQYTENFSKILVTTEFNYPDADSIKSTVVNEVDEWGDMSEGVNVKLFTNIYLLIQYHLKNPKTVILNKPSGESKKPITDSNVSDAEEITTWLDASIKHKGTAKATGKGSKHAHEYEVRGFNRTLRSGKTIWVKPHVRCKGRGTENQHIYKLYKEE